MSASKVELLPSACEEDSDDEEHCAPVRLLLAFGTVLMIALVSTVAGLVVSIVAGEDASLGTV